MTNHFAFKGTFLDTPHPLRVREGDLLCREGLCTGFWAEAPIAKFVNGAKIL